MAGMSDLLQALAQATGWNSVVQPDEYGVVRVALEGDLDIVLFCLGEKFCVMRGVVLELPTDEQQRRALCEQAARLQVAAVREKSSILAVEEPGMLSVPGETLDLARLICYRSLPLSVDTGTFIENVQAWLNDYAWWKANLNPSNEQGSSMSSFFSAGQFSGLKL